MRPIQTKVIPRAFSEESVSNSTKADKIVLGNSDDVNDDSVSPRAHPTTRWDTHKIAESAPQDAGGKNPPVIPHLKVEGARDNPSNKSTQARSERSLSFINKSSKSDSGGPSILNILREQDVFDIDEQTRLLSEDLQKTKLSRRGNNAFSRKKPFIRRVLTCVCIFSPRAMSSQQMHSVAKTGDLFLDRDDSTFEGQRLSSDVIRGIRSTLDGKYMPKTRDLQLWSRVSFVVSLSNRASQTQQKAVMRRMSWTGRPVEPKITTKYVMFADNRGVRIRPLQDVLSANELQACLTYMHDNRYVSGLRPVVVKSAGLSSYSVYADGLEELATLCVEKGGYLPWTALRRSGGVGAADNSEQITVAATSGLPLRRKDQTNSSSVDFPDPHPSEENVASTLSPWLHNFADKFFRRLRGIAFQPAAETIAEATRCFHLIAANFEQQPETVRESFNQSDGKDIRSNAFMSKLLSHSTSGIASGEWEHVPSAFLKSHLAGMLQQGVKSGANVGDSLFDERLENLLAHMDEDADGSITLLEFLEAFVSVPCASMPHEFDLPAVAGAEMAACLLTELGLFSEDALVDSRFYHPQSFSASSSSSTLETMTAISAAPVTNSSGNSKKGTKKKTLLKNLKSCATVTPRTMRCQGVKFGDDILLKIKK